MVSSTFGDIFIFIPETNITEEYFYKHPGVYPVFSGQTEGEGVTTHIDSYNEEGACVTFTTYGVGAGKLYYRDGQYTIGRNCMGLRPKEQYKNDIDLRWFSYHYQGLFYKLRIGDQTGQRSLNKTLLANVMITIPEKCVQQKQLSLYHKAHKMSREIARMYDLFRGILNINFQIGDFAHEDTINNIFNIKGGNSGLTEEFIYYNQPHNKEEEIRIFSSATTHANQMGTISKNATPNGSPLRVFSGPCILVARNGYAGTMTYIHSDEFTTNDHAYVLIPKRQWISKINLEWFAHQYQYLFYNLVTSKSDNATFSKDYVKDQLVRLPHTEKQNSIAKKCSKVRWMIEELDRINAEITCLTKYTMLFRNTEKI